MYSVLYRCWILVFAVSLVIISCSQTEQSEAEAPPQDLVKRGEYLVLVGGCNDCHTPKVYSPHGPMPDSTRLLSGHPADAKLPEFDPEMVKPGKWILFNDHITATVGPWGITYAANLTPDEQTGLGLWTEEVFLQAMRSGKHAGTGRPIMPPMPWFNLAQMPDADLKAIFAYLESLEPVKNKVPEFTPMEILATQK